MGNKTTIIIYLPNFLNRWGLFELLIRQWLFKLRHEVPTDKRSELLNSPFDHNNINFVADQNKKIIEDVPVCSISDSNGSTD